MLKLCTRTVTPPTSPRGPYHHHQIILNAEIRHSHPTFEIPIPGPPFLHMSPIPAHVRKAERGSQAQVPDPENATVWKMPETPNMRRDMEVDSQVYRYIHCLRYTYLACASRWVVGVYSSFCRYSYSRRVYTAILPPCGVLSLCQTIASSSVALSAPEAASAPTRTCSWVSAAVAQAPARPSTVPEHLLGGPPQAGWGQCR